MGIRIEITVVSTNHHAGMTGHDHEVRIAQEYDGNDGNARYDADVVLHRGRAMVLTIARQLAQLAELDGGPLFTNKIYAEALGRGEDLVR